MKRYVAALLVVLGVVGVVGVLAIGAGYAKNKEDAGAKKCSEATLNGTYLLGYDGVAITGGKRGKQVPFAVAGYAVFGGNGNVEQVFSVNFNGDVSSNERLSGGTYDVKANCTGTSTFKARGGPYKADLFISPDGSMYTFVQTNPSELVASGFTLRGTAKRVGD
jgi:hypothetical protein